MPSKRNKTKENVQEMDSFGCLQPAGAHYLHVLIQMYFLRGELRASSQVDFFLHLAKPQFSGKSSLQVKSKDTKQYKFGSIKA